MKGLILCAGKGTRLRPLSYSQPKTLLPVAGKPVLFYCIEKLVEAGIRDIGIVLNPFQQSMIHGHLAEVKRKFGVSITYIDQEDPQGISDALRRAEHFLEQEPFLLLLGDNLIQESLTVLKKQLEQEKVSASVMLAKVGNPEDYGIADIQMGRVVALEEKPSAPKSNLAVIGAYAFTADILTAVRRISPSARGEYEITDAIQWLIDHGAGISYSVTEEHYSDVGTPSRWLEANRWKLDEITGGTSSISPQAQVENCTLIPPVLVGQGCQLKHSVIGPFVSLAPQAKIEKCRVKNSILLEGVHLQHIPQLIEQSIFGRFSRVSGLEREWKTSSFVLGDHSSIIFHGRDQL